jgi:hypothetical protein
MAAVSGPSNGWVSSAWRGGLEQAYTWTFAVRVDEQDARPYQRFTHRADGLRRYGPAAPLKINNR